MQSKGHKEIGTVDSARTAELRALLGMSEDIVWFEWTDSTNDRIKCLIKESLESERFIRVANAQTHGHGTRDRVWLNETESLLLSVGIPASEHTQGITLAMGMGIRDVLQEAGQNLWLKWPNDLWTQQSKAGGILCETLAHQGHSWLIVGVGINLKCADETHGNVHVDLSKERLCANIVRRICQEAEHFSTQRLKWISEHWKSVDWIGKKRLSFTTPSGETLVGFSAGVDEEGCFVLRDAQGEHHFPSGSIRISE